MSDDSDETEGRKLYRARADVFAASLWQKRSVKMSDRKIVFCARGHRSTVPAEAYSDGIGASHSCPICGLGVPKEPTAQPWRGLRNVMPPADEMARDLANWEI